MRLSRVAARGRSLGDGSVVIAGGVKVRVGIICSGVEATTAPVSVRWERFKGTDVVLG
jgi:hypothetical protein